MTMTGFESWWTFSCKDRTTHPDWIAAPYRNRLVKLGTVLGQRPYFNYFFR